MEDNESSVPSNINIIKHGNKIYPYATLNMERTHRSVIKTGKDQKERMIVTPTPWNWIIGEDRKKNKLRGEKTDKIKRKERRRKRGHRTYNSGVSDMDVEEESEVNYAYSVQINENGRKRIVNYMEKKRTSFLFFSMIILLIIGVVIIGIILGWVITFNIQIDRTFKEIGESMQKPLKPIQDANMVLTIVTLSVGIITIGFMGVIFWIIYTMFLTTLSNLTDYLYFGPQYYKMESKQKSFITKILYRIGHSIGKCCTWLTQSIPFTNGNILGRIYFSELKQLKYAIDEYHLMLQDYVRFSPYQLNVNMTSTTQQQALNETPTHLKMRQSFDSTSMASGRPSIDCASTYSQSTIHSANIEYHINPLKCALFHMEVIMITMKIWNIHEISSRHYISKFREMLNSIQLFIAEKELPLTIANFGDRHLDILCTSVQPEHLRGILSFIEEMNLTSNWLSCTWGVGHGQLIRGTLGNSSHRQFVIYGEAKNIAHGCADSANILGISCMVDEWTAMHVNSQQLGYARFMDMLLVDCEDGVKHTNQVLIYRIHFKRPLSGEYDWYPLFLSFLDESVTPSTPKMVMPVKPITFEIFNEVKEETNEEEEVDEHLVEYMQLGEYLQSSMLNNASGELHDWSNKISKMEKLLLSASAISRQQRLEENRYLRSRQLLNRHFIEHDTNFVKFQESFVSVPKHQNYSSMISSLLSSYQLIKDPTFRLDSPFPRD